MIRKGAFAIVVAAIVSASPIVAQERLKSFVPDNPTIITTAHDCKQVYLTNVWFRGYSDPEVLQAGRTAAERFGYPGALIEGDGDGNAFYLRAVDIRDMSGLLRFIKQFKNTNGLRIGYLPLQERYSTLEEQQAAMDDSPTDSIVELGGEC